MLCPCCAVLCCLARAACVLAGWHADQYIAVFGDPCTLPVPCATSCMFLVRINKGLTWAAVYLQGTVVQVGPRPWYFVVTKAKVSTA
mgnify:CR=1 FL=1